MPKTGEHENVARVDVVDDDARPRAGRTECRIGANLHFDAEALASYFFAQWEPVVFDALLIAAAVEFCDKLKRRSSLLWPRAFELQIPVHDSARWAQREIAGSLQDALEFLTGDRWGLEFVPRKKPADQPQQGLFDLPVADSPAVVPFSEGLDSRAVAGLMARELGDRLIRARLGTKSADRPKEPSGRKLPFAAVPYNVRPSNEKRFVESSARSRGFKFALLSGLAAYLAKADRIIVPESGQGALGPSLVPVGQAYEDYRNHPMFTDKMSVFLKALLDREFRFEFPRLWSTKGQTLREYASGHGVSPKDWADTRSCWQDNRHVSVNRHRRQCGICAACMLRRLSVHAAGLSERKDTYIWEDLRAASFESGAARGFNKMDAQRNYAIAGTLHLDHLASLRRSPIHEHRLNLSAYHLARSFGAKKDAIRGKIDDLLNQHEQEWNAFMDYLGPNSFVAKWTERAA